MICATRPDGLGSWAMKHFRPTGHRRIVPGRATVVEATGLCLAIAGLQQIYEPAALIFAGAALVLLAQGMERPE